MKLFKRGKGPLVSVLLPTRCRSESLCEAIDSIYSLAEDKSSVEFIFKIDDDDPDTIRASESLSRILPIKSIVSPRGRGYHDMHHWVNQMCALSEGDWLFLFNDDARMKTQGWDKLLADICMVEGIEGISELCLLLCETMGRPPATEFMFLRRKVYEILGHYSLSPHNDRWIHSVLTTINAVFKLEVMIEHKDKEMDDLVRHEVLEAYVTTAGTLNDLSALKNKVNDISTLISYLESRPKLNIDPSFMFGHRWLERKNV